MFFRLELKLRRLRRRLSRAEWLVRLLRLPVSRGTADRPGLILIQIDGLPRAQLERAMRHGRLPWLRKLIRRHHYRLHSHYSGVPSTTPAVQAELFYGVPCAVPAFCFYHRHLRRVFQMYHPADAQEIQDRIHDPGPRLLAGGSAYADIYTGGADEAHFCGPVLGFDRMFRRGSPFVLPLALLLHLPSLLRVLGLTAVELVIALFDSLRGSIRGRDLWMELKFVPTRVGVCIALRELAAFSAMLDIARGRPIVHLNLLGFDEQSHRRGPTSAFAHWVLKGIDATVRRLHKAARRSARRDYEVWIYSDHGQEHVIPFQYEVGDSLRNVITRIFHEAAAPRPNPRASGVQQHRLRLLSRALPRWLTPASQPDADPGAPDPEDLRPVVAAMGPVAHVYTPPALIARGPLTETQSHDFARRMVAAGVPLVLLPIDKPAPNPEADAARNPAPDPSTPLRARAFTPAGTFELPRDAAAVLGPRHPLLADVARDLARLPHNRHAGDFVLSGFRRAPLRPLSFSIENGAHAGPGPNETHAFALLPTDAPLPNPSEPHIRPTTIRDAALAHLDRMDAHAPHTAQSPAPPHTPPPTPSAS